MREKTVVPTNLIDWPAIAPLLPEVKLILCCGLWGGRYTNMLGVAEIPLPPLAASLGLDPSALASGIKVLCNEGLIIGDWETGEFFIVAWFRFHQFKNAGISMATQQFARIRSATVRNAVLKAAPWLGELKLVQSKQKGNPPTAATKVTSSSAEKIRIRRTSGIVTYLPTDPDRAEVIENSYSAQQILDAVEVIEGRGKEPVPGIVQKELERTKKMAAQEQLRSEQEELAMKEQADRPRRSQPDFDALLRLIGREGPR